MRVIFPEEEVYETLHPEKLEFLLSMLEIEDVDLAKTRKFPLIVAQPYHPFKYFGQMILFANSEGLSRAVAREVYGQHLVGAHNHNAANNLANQITWLADHQENLGSPNDTYSAVILSSPNAGAMHIALTAGRYRDIGYVLQPEQNATFSLAIAEDYVQSLNERFDLRISAIEETRQRFGNNIDGLPA